MNRTAHRALAGAALLVGAALASGAAEAQPLRLMTGPQGGSWYPLGGAIQNLSGGHDIMPGAAMGAGGEGYFRAALTQPPARLQEAAARLGDLLS